MPHDLHLHPVGQIASAVLVSVLASVYVFFKFGPRSLKRKLVLCLFNNGRPAPLKDKPYSERVLPHGEIERIGPYHLWILEGTLPQPGPKFGRNMLIYQRPHQKEKSLVVFSPVCIAPEAEALLDTASITHVVVPSSMHRLDAEAYKSKYSQVKVVCPAKAREAVSTCVEVDSAIEEVFTPEEVQADKQSIPAGSEQLRKKDLQEEGGLHSPHDITFLSPDGMYEEFDELVYFLRLEHMDGRPQQEGTAIVVTDLFFNLDPARADPVTRALGSAAGFGVTRLGRAATVRDAARLARWLRGALLPRARARRAGVLVVAHGAPVVGRAAVVAALERAADGLAPRCA